MNARTRQAEYMMNFLHMMNFYRKATGRSVAVALAAFALVPAVAVAIDPFSAPPSSPLPIAAAKQADTLARSRLEFVRAHYPELKAAELTVTGERISFFSGRVPREALDVLAAAGNKALIPAAGPTLSASEYEKAAIGLAFVGRYRELFGVGSTENELAFKSTEIDALGVTHLTYQQFHQGIEVFQSAIDVHVGHDGSIIAAGNGFVPEIHLSKSQPALSKSMGLEKLHQARPGATVRGDARLVVYPQNETTAHPSASLAWIIETFDAKIPSRSLNVIDAQNGHVIDVIELLADAQERRTYSANFSSTLPGYLARTEGQAPVNAPGLPDIDRAHDQIGAAYSYFRNTHDRDSWNGAGAQCNSTAYYRSEPAEAFRNAYWDGESRWVFGEGMVAKDVVGHEFTHAVTQTTANLVYRFQSGALNESMSDVFGAMIERRDWTIGESTALGTLRDMSDPASPALASTDPSLDRRQPAHTSQYWLGCGDCGGVHRNSGIPNRAFYLIATALSNEIAERIYYRALRYYLQERSHFKDARAALVQSATDLYQCDGPEVLTVRNAFNTVGITPGWEPPPTGCSALTCVCSATVTTTDPTIFRNALQGMRVAASLYGVRDTLLSSGHGIYYRELFERHNGRMALLLLTHADLRRQFGQLLADLSPGLDALVAGTASRKRVPTSVARQATAFFEALARSDRAGGGGALAAAIDAETARLSIPAMAELTFEQAWARFAQLPAEKTDATQ